MKPPCPTGKPDSATGAAIVPVGTRTCEGFRSLFQASPWMCQMEMFIFSGSSLCALWGALGSKVLSPGAPSSPRPRAGGLELPCPLWMSLEQWPSCFQGSYHRFIHTQIAPLVLLPPHLKIEPYIVSRNHRLED